MENRGNGTRSRSASPKPLRSGDRVYLRHPVWDDREEFLGLMEASRSFLERFNPWPPEGVDPYDETYFRAIVDTSHTETSERLYAFRNADDALLGYLHLSVITRGALDGAYLGYSIGAPYAARGYMTQALGLALEHAFEGLDLHRVEANIQPENDRSIALVRRLGFSKEGFSPRYLRIGGQWRDHERWALLVEDWREMRASLDYS